MPTSKKENEQTRAREQYYTGLFMQQPFEYLTGVNIMRLALEISSVKDDVSPSSVLYGSDLFRQQPLERPRCVNAISLALNKSISHTNGYL